jgi:hypothetical protein
MRYAALANGAVMSARALKQERVATQATAKQVSRGGLSKRARRKVRRKIRLAAHHSRSISVVGGLLL